MPDEQPERAPATPPVSSGKGCENESCPCRSSVNAVHNIDVQPSVRSMINAYHNRGRRIE